MNMNKKIILASSSSIRQKIFSNAGISFLTDPANIDEESIKLSLEQIKKSHEEITQTLSDFKGLNNLNSGALKPSSILVVGVNTIIINI